MQLCCGITKEGNDCPNPSLFRTDENLFVCNMHKGFSISKKEHILKMVKENEFNKQRKEFIESLNKELLDGHEFDIPLTNKYSLIIDFAFVSKSDFDEVNKYKWFKTPDGYAVKSYNQETASLMHRYILGKPDDCYMIDHIDNNKLNNRRENLRFVTSSENNQNRSKKLNTTSKYIGIYFTKNKWRAQCATNCTRKYLGAFENEIDAAKRYDTYVYLKFGSDAKTNNLIKYDEIKITLDDFEITKKERDLPPNIYKVNDSYNVRIIYKIKVFEKIVKSLDEAKEILEIFKNQIVKLKAQEEQERLSKEIERNEDGLAIIKVSNYNVIVDDDKYHEFLKYTWIKDNNNYFITEFKKVKYSMHRFVIKAEKGDIVDHIDRNKFDNRLQNLRIVTSSINNHNKAGRGSSNFRGVCYIRRDNIWSATITKDRIIYVAGNYKKEIQAAIAVNIKSKELYGDYANLNKISEEDLQENLPIVEAKMQALKDVQDKKKNNYRGVRLNPSNKWDSIITFNKKRYYLGLFETKEEAALAYNKKATELLGDKAKLNVIS
jgi:hypothetical protein